MCIGTSQPDSDYALWRAHELLAGISVGLGLYPGYQQAGWLAAHLSCVHGRKIIDGGCEVSSILVREGV